MGVLWLAGVAMRMTILAMPPVIPLMHDELRMSETAGRPPGRPAAGDVRAGGGAGIAADRADRATACGHPGMVIAALAGAARAAAIDVATLYAAAIATGFGVAIMQPAMPTLVREWLPGRIALGTIAYTSGMLMGATFPPVLTIPYVLPLVGGSWRLNLVVWAVPALLIVAGILSAEPEGRRSTRRHGGGADVGGRISERPAGLAARPDASAATTAPYFATSAFLGDYLASKGRAGPARRGARPGSTARSSSRWCLAVACQIGCSGGLGPS